MQTITVHRQTSSAPERRRSRRPPLRTSFRSSPWSASTSRLSSRTARPRAERRWSGAAEHLLEVLEARLVDAADDGCRIRLRAGARLEGARPAHRAFPGLVVVHAELGAVARERQRRMEDRVAVGARPVAVLLQLFDDF